MRTPSRRLSIVPIQIRLFRQLPNLSFILTLGVGGDTYKFGLINTIHTVVRIRSIIQQLFRIQQRKSANVRR